jgi:hypothetical protein
VNLLAGASGVGKTCLVTWLLQRLRENRTAEHGVFGHPVTAPPKIVYISADRGWAGALDWFTRAGWPDIPHYAFAEDPSFNLRLLRRKSELINLLATCIDKFGDLPRGSLVCIDTVGIFLGGNLNDYFSVAIALLELRRLCVERGITVIGLCHAGKQKSDPKEQYNRPQDRILGSAALLGYADTQMYLAPPSETGGMYYEFSWNPHLAPEQTFRMTRADNGLFIPYDEAAETVATETRRVVDIQARLDTDPHVPLVLGLITDAATGSSTGSILSAALPTISRATTFRIVNMLAQAGQIESLGRGVWRRVSVPTAPSEGVNPLGRYTVDSGEIPIL